MLKRLQGQVVLLYTTAPVEVRGVTEPCRWHLYRHAPAADDDDDVRRTHKAGSMLLLL